MKYAIIIVVGGLPYLVDNCSPYKLTCLSFLVFFGFAVLSENEGHTLPT